MNFLSVLKLSKSFGIRTLFREVTFHVNEGDQIALVAKNGSGKSTLLKILAGKETSDSGEVLLAKGVKIILFEQSDDFNEDIVAEDYIFSHANPILEVVHRYDKVLEEDPASEELITLIEKMTELEAWDVEVKIQEILSNLKIDFLSQKIGDLSGGQRKRIALAKFLIDVFFEQGHVLLILDEPTNHLDIDMVEWLEYFLNKENKTCILVTHDRYFLDAISTKILELEDETMYVHSGDYEVYIRNKASRIENMQAQISTAKNLYRKELEWMRRQPKARTTKSKSRIDSFYDVEERAKKKIKDEKLAIDMQMTRLGNKVIEMKGVSKRFGEKIILDNLSYVFARGVKIGIIGNNGVGKTTFLKMLEGEEAIDTGIIERGETLNIGHFKQSDFKYKSDQRVIDFVKDIADYFPLSNGKQMTAGQFLEMFLFSPETQYTYIDKLSGGEKKRLQLLSVLYKNPNFLILDEPTNDLDLPTLTVLEEFLREYQGCVLIVSHDRYFMDKVVDELMVFEGLGKVSLYIGNYTQYYIDLKYKQEQEKKLLKEGGKQEEVVDIQVEEKKEVKEESTKKLSFNEKRELEELGKNIPELENKKKELTDKLSDASLSFEEIQSIGEELQKNIDELDIKETRWLELNE